MTITTPTTDTTPRAWIGCLACYNEGRLVGDWYDAINADEVTTYDLHGAHSRADSHDELWVMDHENIPVSGEMSPAPDLDHLGLFWCVGFVFVLVMGGLGFGFG